MSRSQTCFEDGFLDPARNKDTLIPACSSKLRRMCFASYRPHTSVCSTRACASVIYDRCYCKSCRATISFITSPKYRTCTPKPAWLHFESEPCRRLWNSISDLISESIPAAMKLCLFHFVSPSSIPKDHKGYPESRKHEICGVQNRKYSV